MSSRFQSSDFLSGLTFSGLALVIQTQLKGLELAGEMGIGPGYFPMLCSAGLAAIGFGLMLRGVLKPVPSVELRLGLRVASYVTTGVIAFALLLYPLGLVVATFALVILATRSTRSISLGAAALTATVIALVCALIFSIGLRLPFPLLPAAL